MTPDVGVVLGGIVRTLLTELAPELRTPYATMTAQLMGTLLLMASQEADRAAARLVEENDVLRALFADAEPVVAEHTLGADLRASLATPPCALTVSALRERNARLRALLVRLHAHVEALDGPAARVLEERIWAELVTSTERRRLDLALA